MVNVDFRHHLNGRFPSHIDRSASPFFLGAGIASARCSGRRHNLITRLDFEATLFDTKRKRRFHL